MRQNNINVHISMHCSKNLYCFSSAIVSDGQIVEYCKTQGITDDFNKACDIFRVLNENEVFPCHLHNVIDELI